MFIRKTKFIFPLLLLTLLIGQVPGRALADTPELEEVKLVGQLQSVLLTTVQTALGGWFLAEPEAKSALAKGLKDFGEIAGRIRSKLKVDKPGYKIRTKYYNKLVAKYADVKLTGLELFKTRPGTRDLDPKPALALRKSADQVTYRIHELIRHCSEKADLKGYSQDRRRDLAEALVILEMEANLYHAAKEAITENITAKAGEAVAYWHNLGTFDFNAALYRTLVDLHDPANKTKAEMFAKLLELKHDLLNAGESVYVRTHKTARPAKPEVKDLMTACRKIGPVLAKLLEMAGR